MIQALLAILKILPQFIKLWEAEVAKRKAAAALAKDKQDEDAINKADATDDPESMRDIFNNKPPK